MTNMEMMICLWDESASLTMIGRDLVSAMIVHVNTPLKRLGEETLIINKLLSIMSYQKRVIMELI